MADSLEDSARTVWVAPSVTGELPYKHTHIARVFHTQDIVITEKKEVASGVTAHYGIEKGSSKAIAYIYHFDASKFDEAKVKDWLSQNGVNVQTIEPDSQYGLLQSQPLTGSGIQQKDIHGDALDERLDLDDKKRSAPSEAIVNQKEILQDLLAVLHAVYWNHQTTHWQVEGTRSYSDHLLFQRLYEPIKGQMDELAEKMVGKLSSEAVNQNEIQARSNVYTVEWGKIDDHVQRALAAENQLQTKLKSAYDQLKGGGELSLGLDDFIMGLSSQHDTATYLLGQATKISGGSTRSENDDAMYIDGSVRSINLLPGTCDDGTMSVEAVLATEAPVMSTAVATGKPVYEVWMMRGMVYDDTIPLLDDHNRKSVRNVIGSVRNISDTTLEDGTPAKKGRLYISASEPNIWQKIKEGHIRQVSAGVSPLESETIPAGQVRTINGSSYAARPDQPMFVRTRTRMREVSLTPIAADHRTQIRSLSKEIARMNPKTLSFLFAIGLKQGSTEEQAKAFYDSLPETTRALADAAATKRSVCPECNQEHDGEEGNCRSCTDKAASNRSAQQDETVYRKAIETERKRVAEIRRLGEGLPEETVRGFIEDGTTPEVAAPRFIEMLRGRTAPAAASRSFEKDVTAEVLGAAITIRSLNEADDHTKLKTANPLDLFGGGGYRSVGKPSNAGTDWVRQRAFNKDTIRKANEQLLEKADRFSRLSMLDICRMACQLDGIAVSGYDPGETIRSAGSGSSLAAIFTTNFNALFLAGYLDAVDTTVGWVTESDVPNFMPAERATVGKMGGLRPHTPNRPAEHMDMGDWNEYLQVRRFSGQFKVDEMDLINDRFGALNQMSPTELGLAARQLRPNMVYSALLKNPTLNQDNTAVFDAAHSNYATTGTRLTDPADASAPVYAKPLQTAIAAMGQQRMRNRPLNLFPRYLLVPPALRWAAAILLQSSERVISTGSGGTFNPLRDLGIEPRVEARLNATGCPDPTNDDALVAGSDAGWYLACQPGEQGAKTIEVGYLRGTGRAPQIRSFVMDKGEWGIGWDVKMDIGVVILDYRCLYHATGAA